MAGVWAMSTGGGQVGGGVGEATVYRNRLGLRCNTICVHCALPWLPWRRYQQLRIQPTMVASLLCGGHSKLIVLWGPDSSPRGLPVSFTPLGPRWNQLHNQGVCTCNPQQVAAECVEPRCLVSRRDHGAVHRSPTASHHCHHCGNCVCYISPWSLCAPTQATCSPVVSIALV